jgi:Fe2+ transport system protein FeoA
MTDFLLIELEIRMHKKKPPGGPAVFEIQLRSVGLRKNLSTAGGA